MNTITKLHIAVNNDALPIITEDGHLVNSHVAQYVAKLSEKGYTMTTEELNAVSALVDDAIAHGWLRYVDYFFPFIGNKTHLAASMVPLIDRYTGYDVYQDTPLEDGLFTYKADNTSIKSFGHPDRSSVSGARGLVIDKFYAVKNQFFGIAPDEDFSALYDKNSASLSLCGYLPEGYLSISNNARTVRSLRAQWDSEELYLYRYEQNSATAQVSAKIRPQTPLGSYNSDFLFHINGKQADGKYTQYCVNGSGQILRDFVGISPVNVYVATPGMPFIGSQNINGSGYLTSITPPYLSIYVFGVLNEITTGDVNRQIGADILKFMRALGKIQ